MKLSFSTKGWHNKSFDEFCNIARELKFGGIELHNINGELFKNKDGAFHGYAAAATVRRLYEMKLELPCIDVISDICEEGAIAETESCIKIAEELDRTYTAEQCKKIYNRGFAAGGKSGCYAGN